METVNELRKLLDIDLESLTNGDCRDHNLSVINRNSDRLSQSLGTALVSGKPNEPKAKVRFRLDNEKLSQHQNIVKIVRDEPKPSRIEKRPFLRKGDGLKRFGIQKTNLKPANVFQNVADRSSVEPDKIECDKSTIDYQDKGTDPIDSDTQLSIATSDEWEDSFIAETNQQIRMLEYRIERLYRLKATLIEMDDNQDLMTKLNLVEKNLEDINNKFHSNHSHDVAEQHFPNGAFRTIEPDQTIVVKFANGQMERLLPNGDKQITYPDGVQAWIKQSDHSEQIRLVDGSTYCCYANGVQKRYYPNGDVEIRTNTYVKRKFASGKVKTVYSNGLQEILYNDGRLLFKDGRGHILGADYL
uniref:Uncharacterized protein LOC113790011 n=1 Tax=Dermatophagoides pteronyssinus TaxID=6956 RepID=A0A6P6XU37_DERPT|nr:uncharacterized protein LOC113790011 [Dermatophagoides pteronyssinus]